MKKKYKWLSLIISLIMCFSIFGLAACNMDKLDTPKEDENGSLDPSGGNEDNETPDVATGDYISGITIIYRPDAGTSDDMFLDGVTGTPMSFNQLLDRQFSMLSDDILNRLVGIYGAGYTNFENDEIKLTDKDGHDVTLLSANPLLGFSTAQYLPKNAVATYNDSESGYIYANGNFAGLKVDDSHLDLTQPESWAKECYGTGSFSTDINNTNNPLIVKNFGFVNTIIGHNATAQRGNLTNEFAGFVNSLDQYLSPWNWNTMTAITISETNSELRNIFRLALSDVILTSKVNAEKYTTPDPTTYESNLSNINHLGILSYDKKIIVDLIKEVVIGKDLIDKDTAALELLKSKADLENFNGFEPDSETLQTMTQDQLDELDLMHTYKAYDVILNAIVEQAVNNTFATLSDEIAKPIYPQMPRLKTMFMTWEQIDDQMEQTKEDFKTSTSLTINSIIIHPKNDMQLNLAYLLFESLNEQEDFFVNINIKFVADSKEYKGSKKTKVKVGSGDIGDYEDSGNTSDPTGPNIPPAPETNDFTIEASDFESFKTNEKNEDNSGSNYNPDDPSSGPNIEPPSGASGGDVYKFPVWHPNVYIPSEAITTFNNPYTMEQTDSTSAIVYYDGGTNYMELSFQFFKDEELTEPMAGIPEFSFGIQDFDFEYENLKDPVYAEENS